MRKRFQKKKKKIIAVQALETADLVIEAVVENLGLKQKLFG
jgi:3-hydroxyacyl-CoA dehydrogenase